MRIRTPRRFRSSILSPPRTLWKSGATTHGCGVDSYLREAQRGNCVQRMIAHRIRTNQVDRRVATWAANLGSKLALPFSESIIPMQIAAEEAVGEYGEKLLRSLVQVFDLQSAVKTLLPKGKYDYRNYMIAHAYTPSAHRAVLLSLAEQVKDGRVNLHMYELCSLIDGSNRVREAVMDFLERELLGE